MTKTITVFDKMQQGYTYEVSEPMGKNFHPDFQPELTPAQMLELGIFAGVYMRDCTAEFPANWFDRAKFATGKRDPKLNYFGVDASQTLKVWQDKGWIHSDDPRGWFQWYCRYYIGRRHTDDERQIKRWRAFRRHIAQIKLNCLSGDHSCRKKQRQALLHWAYDSRDY